MDLIVRRLESGDYDKGFLGLLAQLTTVGDIDKTAFEQRLKEVSSDDYHIAVVEDKASGKLVGTAALIVERKFIHACGKASGVAALRMRPAAAEPMRVGHIEDVVVDQAARGQRLGQRLIEELVRVCKEKGCYKVILDCADHNVAFYEKCGLTRKEIQMVRYLDR
ncbi:glucosamine-phosphateN-acetyltransferase [Monoraphidium neglectum]|uniref:Glucosamine 6-phosphate N-acetyltransferase n=1 Tax=Monoraphidium neglectum TaxID=145388 RepID=A0A0D2NGJ9_9CHLO|nr:glucosamine-phosphateN-acetyltransferase [Monoraphidium neglectum]KIZ04131.1 glucosamine-phosphateN-acetyltransferase [Monoraphidium neglectum]|eukprot:XP_013903150.1 glucosamine-phosphateN-acetyltransferase [Monoraphidium neglectum]